MVGAILAAVVDSSANYAGPPAARTRNAGSAAYRRSLSTGGPEFIEAPRQAFS